MKRALEKWLVPPYPVRTTVGVRLRNVLVELDVVAVYPDGLLAAP
jgi:hypothetical protein